MKENKFVTKSNTELWTDETEIATTATTTDLIIAGMRVIAKMMSITTVPET